MLSSATSYKTFLIALAGALTLGILAVIPMGGSHMPIVISLLNSYSGLAASAAGFVIENSILIVAGSLVGAQRHHSHHDPSVLQVTRHATSSSVWHVFLTPNSTFNDGSTDKGVYVSGADDRRTLRIGGTAPGYWYQHAPSSEGVERLTNAILVNVHSQLRTEVAPLAVR